MERKFVVGDVWYQPAYPDRMYAVLKASQDGLVCHSFLVLGSNEILDWHGGGDSGWKMSYYPTDKELVRDVFLSEVYKTKGEVNGR